MRILVLNGSPKREHSDTMHITRAFLERMNEATKHEENYGLALGQIAPKPYV